VFGEHDVWTWDITKLPLVRRGIYLSLYVVLDLFSRFVVAWMVSRKENSALAKQLMDEATTRYGIEPGQLTLHQDRGSPMIAHGYPVGWQGLPRSRSLQDAIERWLSKSSGRLMNVTGKTPNALFVDDPEQRCHQQ
jgi:transposase InsO family protein